MVNSDLKRFTKQTRTLLSQGTLVKMLLLGDSISAGFMVSRGFGHFWKEMLEEKYPRAQVEMINRGVCGETALDGLYRLDGSVISHQPHLVTINFGINDMYMGVRLGEFKSNLIEMVSRILDECNSEILLISSEPLLTPGFDQKVLSYYQMLADVAEDMNVGFVDGYRAWMRKVEDGIPLKSLILPGMDHPNEKGYKIIAEELMRFF